MNTKKMKWLILILAAGFYTSSCVKDTCNGALGNTFSAILFDSTQTEDALLTVHFTVETLADLPENYFTDIVASDSATMSQTNAVTLTQTALTLALSETAHPLPNETRDLNFTFALPDRRSFIDCQHPGSADIYFITISFTLYNNADSTYELTNFIWEELFVAGYL